MACGALSPLEGFMGSDVDDMRLTSGLPWALPVCLAVDPAPRGERALADATGQLLGDLGVEEVYRYDPAHQAVRCFGTNDPRHPAVRRLHRERRFYLAGRVTVFRQRPALFPELALDPIQTRARFKARSWRRVVGF